MYNNNRIKESLFIAVFPFLFHQQLFCETPKDSIYKQPIILMSSQILDEMNMNVDFISSFDFTPQKQILLSSLNQFYLLGWESFVPLDHILSTPISSFTYDSENNLLVVLGNNIFVLNTQNQFVQLFPLPRENMEICPGKNGVIYAYDKEGQENYVLYRLKEKEAPIKIFEISTPITAVLEVNENILFATNSKVFFANLKDKTVKALVQLANVNEKIISMAQDYSNDVLYFSTNNALYALRKKQAECVMEKIGGLIKCYNNELYVFNPKEKFLISFYINNLSATKETKEQ